MIPMLQSLSDQSLIYKVGSAQIIDHMNQLGALQPFSEEVIGFLNELSIKLLATGRQYSDVVTLAYWCRKASMLKEKEKYDDIHLRLGRGIVFHIAPSNVPVNFAFSFVAGLLTGNANIVRLPTKPFAQVDIICEAINQVLNEKSSKLNPFISMIQYPSSSHWTGEISKVCDTRIIWGGDQTIANIRKFPLKPRANEITFADRFSIAVIDSDEYLKSERPDQLAMAFYNDTYYSDQNACTSPRIVVWLGDAKAEAKKLFWQRLYEIVKEKYDLSAVQSVGKLTAAFQIAALRPVKIIRSNDQYIVRIEVPELDSSLMDYKYNSGHFFEYDAQDLAEIEPICREQCQTVVTYGIQEAAIKKFLFSSRPSGIDRVRNVGKSMDFSLIWDGHDLIRELSRRIDI